MKPEDFMPHGEHKTVKFTDMASLKRLMSIAGMLYEGHDHNTIVNNAMQIGFDANREAEILSAYMLGQTQTLMPNEIRLCDGCIQRAIDKLEQSLGLLKELLVEHKKAS